MRWIVRVLSVFVCAGVALHAAGELSGRQAPGFSLPDSTLKQYDLADYRGKIVLLDFMQTACPHCVVFTKILEEVKAKHGDKIAILSVVNPPSDQAGVQRYMRDTNATSPILFDCGQMAGSYFKMTGQSKGINVPHLFLIDAKGWIVNDYGYGPATKSIFEGRAVFAELDGMLRKASPAKSKK